MITIKEKYAWQCVVCCLLAQRLHAVYVPPNNIIMNINSAIFTIITTILLKTPSPPLHRNTRMNTTPMVVYNFFRIYIRQPFPLQFQFIHHHTINLQI